MLQSAKNKVVATKHFVQKHRVAIAVAVTSSVFVTLQVRNASEWNEFLKTHNLFEEYYYTPETEEEAAALNA